MRASDDLSGFLISVNYNSFFHVEAFTLAVAEQM